MRPVYRSLIAAAEDTTATRTSAGNTALFCGACKAVRAGTCVQPLASLPCHEPWILPWHLSRPNTHAHQMKRPLLLLLTTMSLGCAAQVQTFSNTDAAPCDGWDSGNDYSGFQRTIPVSGLPTPMNITGTVLRQVDLRMGSPACRGDLSTYKARLRSPQGTLIQLFDTFTVATAPQWFDIHYRAGNVQGDAPFLYPVKWYPESVQQAYHPWSIGYYRTGVFAISI